MHEHVKIWKKSNPDLHIDLNINKLEKDMPFCILAIRQTVPFSQKIFSISVMRKNK